MVLIADLTVAEVWELWFGICGLEALLWDLWFAMPLSHLRKFGNLGLGIIVSGILSFAIVGLER